MRTTELLAKLLGSIIGDLTPQERARVTREEPATEVSQKEPYANVTVTLFRGLMTRVSRLENGLATLQAAVRGRVEDEFAARRSEASPEIPLPPPPPSPVTDAALDAGLCDKIPALPPSGTEQRVAKRGDKIVLLVDTQTVPRYFTGTVSDSNKSGVVADFSFGEGHDPEMLGVPHRLYAVVTDRWTRSMAPTESVWDEVDAQTRAEGGAVPAELFSPHGRGCYGDPLNPATDDDVRRAQRRSAGIPEDGVPSPSRATVEPPKQD